MSHKVQHTQILTLKNVKTHTNANLHKRKHAQTQTRTNARKRAQKRTHKRRRARAHMADFHPSLMAFSRVTSGKKSEMGFLFLIWRYDFSRGRCIFPFSPLFSFCFSLLFLSHFPLLFSAPLLLLSSFPSSHNSTMVQNSLLSKHHFPTHSWKSKSESEQANQ